MSKDRFAFGLNWKKFLQNLDDNKIDRAVKSLKEWLNVEDLEGKTFLDIGSGSGLFSLSARRLGAVVHSFDYDNNSVACTQTLKDRYYPNDPEWSVEWGDALSEEYLSKYEQHDIVYSWGVLHHTGSMYDALDKAGKLVKPGGTLFIAIYNDQGTASKCWKAVKKTYNLFPGFLKLVVLIPCFIRLWGPTTIKDILRLKPFKTWHTYTMERGMSPWRDVVDWVGGWPFEVASPEEIFDFYHKRGFTLDKMSTCAGNHGCNQFVFTKLN